MLYLIANFSLRLARRQGLHHRPARMMLITLIITSLYGHFRQTF